MMFFGRLIAGDNHHHHSNSGGDSRIGGSPHSKNTPQHHHLHSPYAAAAAASYGQAQHPQPQPPYPQQQQASPGLWSPLSPDHYNEENPQQQQHRNTHDDDGASSVDPIQAHKLAWLELHRLLHVMEQEQLQQQNQQQQHEQHWRAILMRADVLQQLYWNVLQAAHQGVIPVPNDTMLQSLEERVPAAFQKAQEVAAELRRHESMQFQQQQQHASSSHLHSYPFHPDPVERCFFSPPQQQQHPPQQQLQRKNPSKMKIQTSQDENDDQEENYDDIDYGDGKQKAAATTTSTTSSSTSRQRPLRPNSNSNYAAASASSSSSLSIEQLQQQQREQIEQQIALMAAQMKQETARIHSTLQQQTGSLLNDMEDLAAHNVQAVTEVAASVTEHVRAGWTQSAATWTMFFLTVGTFCFCLLTILTVPQGGSSRPSNVYNRQRQVVGSASATTTTPGLVCRFFRIGCPAQSEQYCLVLPNGRQECFDPTSRAEEVEDYDDYDEQEDQELDYDDSTEEEQADYDEEEDYLQHYKQQRQEKEPLTSTTSSNTDGNTDTDDNKGTDSDTKECEVDINGQCLPTPPSKSNSEQPTASGSVPDQQQEQQTLEAQDENQVIPEEQESQTLEPPVVAESSDLNEESAETTTAESEPLQEEQAEGLEPPLEQEGDQAPVDSLSQETDAEQQQQNEDQSPPEALLEPEQHEGENAQQKVNVKGKDENMRSSTNPSLPPSQDAREDALREYEQLQEATAHSFEDASLKKRREAEKASQAFSTLPPAQQMREEALRDFAQTQEMYQKDAEAAAAAHILYLQQQKQKQETALDTADVPFAGKAATTASSGGGESLPPKQSKAALVDGVPIYKGRPYSAQDVRRHAARCEVDALTDMISVKPDWTDKGDSNGWTAFHQAARSGCTEGIRAMLQMFPHPTTLTVDGKSFWEIAIAKHGTEHEILSLRL